MSLVESRWPAMDGAWKQHALSMLKHRCNVRATCFLIRQHQQAWSFHDINVRASFQIVLLPSSSSGRLPNERSVAKERTSSVS